MTRNEFDQLCSERLIDPALALESDAVVGAIRQGDRDALIEALDTEF